MIESNIRVTRIVKKHCIFIDSINGKRKEDFKRKILKKTKYIIVNKRKQKKLGAI